MTELELRVTDPAGPTSNRVEPAGDPSPSPISIAPGDHPPTFAGAVVAPAHAQSNWPTVIGVLSMVLGALGALNSLSTLFFGVLGAWFFETVGVAQDPQFAASYQSTRENGGIMVTHGVVALLLGCLLFFAGLRVNQRRTSGVMLSKVWAWCKIAFSIFAGITTAMMNMAQIDSTKQQLSAPGVPAFLVNIIGPTMVLIVVFSFLWLIAYPVFTLVWFRRPRVREMTATWPR